MQAISFRAVLLATLAVIGVDILAGMILFGIYAPDVNAHMTNEELQRVIERLMENREYVLVSFVLGTASTVLGGYLAARLARTVPYFNALAFGILGVALGFATSADLPTWYRVLGIGATIPAALFGAQIAKRQMLARGN
jgi:hypothetical protein